jgi:hypothetical protein
MHKLDLAKILVGLMVNLKKSEMCPLIFWSSFGLNMITFNLKHLIINEKLFKKLQFCIDSISLIVIYILTDQLVFPDVYSHHKHVYLNSAVLQHRLTVLKRLKRSLFY